MVHITRSESSNPMTHALLTLAHSMDSFGYMVHPFFFFLYFFLSLIFLPWTFLISVFAVMDSSGEEKKKTGEEVSSAIGATEAEQTEETEQHAGKATLRWDISDFTVWTDGFMSCRWRVLCVTEFCSALGTANTDHLKLKSTELNEKLLLKKVQLKSTNGFNHDIYIHDIHTYIVSVCGSIYIFIYIYIWYYSSESPKKMAASAADEQIRAEAEKEGADGADLSSITSMMSTVMKAAQLNGGVEVSNKTPTKTSSKSPSASRCAKKSQVHIKVSLALTHANQLWQSLVLLLRSFHVHRLEKFCLAQWIRSRGFVPADCNEVFPIGKSSKSNRFLTPQQTANCLKGPIKKKRHKWDQTGLFPHSELYKLTFPDAFVCSFKAPKAYQHVSADYIYTTCISHAASSCKLNGKST